MPGFRGQLRKRDGINVTDYEFELLLEDIQNSFDPSEAAPAVVVYDGSKDSPMGNIYHCDISQDRTRIVVNRDLVLQRYPYADKETIRQILTDEIKRLRMNTHGRK